MIKVGLTGNIGSGKSTAARIFSALGAPIFYADEQAKQLYQEPEIIQKVITMFGNEVANANNEIDFQRLANVVFSDADKLSQLNELLHPRVRKKYYDWLDLHKEFLYTVQEAAIMVESGLYKQMDVVVVITAPQEQRMQRILGRYATSESEVRKRMSRQLPEDQLIKYADYIVKNDDRTMLIPQVLQIHKDLLKEIAD